MSAACSTYLDKTGLAENTVVVYMLRPGLLPGRARLVRQALDVRRVAAHAAAGPLAGGTRTGSVKTRLTSRTSILPRRFLKSPAARTRRHAGPQPRAVAERLAATDWRIRSTTTTTRKAFTTWLRTRECARKSSPSLTSTKPTSGSYSICEEIPPASKRARASVVCARPQEAEGRAVPLACSLQGAVTIEHSFVSTKRRFAMRSLWRNYSLSIILCCLFF